MDLFRIKIRDRLRTKIVSRCLAFFQNPVSNLENGNTNQNLHKPNFFQEQFFVLQPKTIIFDFLKVLETEFLELINERGLALLDYINRAIKMLDDY